MEDMVLMYHDVYKASVQESGFQTDGANHYKIQESAFDEQIQQVKTLPVTLTFDDGGVSFYTIIASILEKNNLRGHFYIATNRIGTDGFMTEAQILDLYKRGHVIGSHSYSHPSDFRVMPFEQRIKEWETSVERLSIITGSPVTEVSIPNGFLQEGDLKIFKSLGITTIFTSKLGENRQVDGMKILGRVGIDNGMSAQQILSIISRGTAYKKMLLKQKVLSVTKAFLGNHYIKIKAFIRKYKK